MSAITPKLRTVKDAAVILGLTNFAVYKLIEAGEIEPRWIKGRCMIPVDVLDEFIANLPTEKPRKDGAA